MAYVPENLDQALSIMARYDLTIIAGRTDVMVRHARYSGLSPALPHNPICIGKIPELAGIERSDGRITVGSTTTLSNIAASPHIPPAMKDVLSDFASPAIRSAVRRPGR